ncbi:MAG: hypothetical protein ABFD50_07310 [Smithella sp.]
MERNLGVSITTISKFDGSKMYFLPRSGFLGQETGFYKWEDTLG